MVAAARAAARQQGRAGERVRAAARGAPGDEPFRPEGVQDLGHVAGHVRDAPARARGGLTVTRPREVDGPQAAGVLGLGLGRVNHQPAARCAVVDDEG